MFIGHYGVSFALKKLEPKAPLGALFVAVQFMDFAFMALLLLGIEKVRIVPGFTKVNAFDFYFMPYSHSLAGALALSVLFGLCAWVLLRKKAGVRRVAALLGAAVFTHYLLDVPVHTPDMPLTFSEASPKLGFGLWNHFWLTMIAETLAFGAGFAFYWRAVRNELKRPKVMLGFVAFLALILFTSPLMPPPPELAPMAIQALVAFTLISMIAAFADQRK